LPASSQAKLRLLPCYNGINTGYDNDLVSALLAPPDWFIEVSHCVNKREISMFFWLE